MSGAACPCCGCTAPGGGRAHAIAAALREDDLDAAMTLGLLVSEAGCPACAPDCRAWIDAARDERRQALAARERHRARAQRLARRERERAERRKPAASAGGADASDGTGTAAAPAATPSLPPAAAAALARAKARAATPSR